MLLLPPPSLFFLIRFVVFSFLFKRPSLALRHSVSKMGEFFRPPAYLKGFLFSFLDKVKVILSFVLHDRRSSTIVDIEIA